MGLKNIFWKERSTPKESPFDLSRKTSLVYNNNLL